MIQFWLNNYFTDSKSTLLTSKIIGGYFINKGSNTHVVIIRNIHKFYGAGALISLKLVITSPFVVVHLPRPKFDDAFVTVGTLCVGEGTPHDIADIRYGRGHYSPVNGSSANFAIIYVSISE